MTEGGDYMANPLLEGPGAPVFDLRELREREGGVLGRGAFGVVRSIEGYPGLAVKEIRLDGLSGSALRSLKFELATLTTFTHPSILRYHQIIEDKDGDLIYIVMARYDTSLETLIMKHRRQREPVSAETIVAFAAQITGALAYLHGFCGTDVDGRPYRGIVHRDLKPANILVSEDGSRVVLADFGLCRNAMASGTTRAGSPAYTAPETLLEGKAAPASDVWSLGVIVYELATLKRPKFQSRKTKRHLCCRVKPDLQPVKDDFIRNILKRIFVLDPEERPAAKELAELFQKPDIPVIELKAPVNVPDERCKSLEVALNGVNARLELLESSLRAKTDEIDSFKEALANKSAEIGALESTIVAQTAEMGALRKKLELKSNQIDAQSSKINTLEGQCKEHLAVMKALENKIALLTTSNPQFELLLLPRLMRAAHTNSIETVRMLVEGGDGIGKRDEQGRTALMYAAQQGHVEPARLLVEKEKGLQDRNGWTALMHAAHNNHLEVVEILAAHERGNRDVSNRTALMIAAERGHTEIVAALAPHEKGLTDSSGNTALMLAAKNAHTEAVRVLVEHEKGARDTRGRTALVHAARAGHRDIAEFLMEHEKDVTGWTTLMCAAVLGDVEMVSQHLSEKGKKDNNGRTALILAAEHGRDEAVRLLMEHEGGASGWTRLIYSAYLGDVDAVKDNLHEKGCKDITGLTALMWAAQQGHREPVEVLIEHEKGVKDNQNHSALYHALKSGHTEAAKIVIPYEDPTDEKGITALMRAAARGDAEMVKLLVPLQKGMKDKDGSTAFFHALKNKHEGIATVLRKHEAPSWTPLMCAAVTGDVETARRHLSDKHKKNSDGKTALMLAARVGHADVVELLDPTTNQDVTALMRAADRGDVDTVKAFTSLQTGRKAEYSEINGWKMYEGTALMRAAAHGHTEIVRLLVEYEAGMQDADGQTALMWAAYHGHLECVELLLNKESGMRDYSGYTALMGAVHNDHLECIKLLVEKEGGVQDDWGCTALIWAVYNNKLECVKLLVESEKDIRIVQGWNGFPIGSTALGIAKCYGYQEIVDLLSK